MNCYGPSEATVAVMTYQLKVEEYRQWPKLGYCPVGLALENIAIKLINREHKAQEDMGECWIAGDQVVNGYIHQNTSHRHKGSFVFEAQTWWYRTGDFIKKVDGFYYFFNLYLEEIFFY